MVPRRGWLIIVSLVIMLSISVGKCENQGKGKGHNTSPQPETTESEETFTTPSGHGKGSTPHPRTTESEETFTTPSGHGKGSTPHPRTTESEETFTTPSGHRKGSTPHPRTTESEETFTTPSGNGQGSTPQPRTTEGEETFTTPFVKSTTPQPLATTTTAGGFTTAMLETTTRPQPVTTTPTPTTTTVSQGTTSSPTTTTTTPSYLSTKSYSSSYSYPFYYLLTPASQSLAFNYQLASARDHENAYTNCSTRYLKCDFGFRYRIPDGSCNNYVPWWGSSFSIFKRNVPPAYENRVDSPRWSSVFGKPLRNAREIANRMNADRDKFHDWSHFLVTFGQYVMHDVAKSGPTLAPNTKDSRKCSCSSESPDCVNVPMPKNEKEFQDLECLAQVRDRDSRQDSSCSLGYRAQTNEATAWLDQSNTYGNTIKQEKALRTFSDGKLRVEHFGESKAPFMPNECEKDSFRLLREHKFCFKTGDERANENVLLAGMHTIWLRVHNKVVGALAKINPEWKDHRLFWEGRRLCNAIYQNIVYNQWLPLVVGPDYHAAFHLGSYSIDYFAGYDKDVFPNVAIDFSAAAARFGHAMVRSLVSRGVSEASNGNMSLHHVLYKPELLVKHGEESLSEFMVGCMRDEANWNFPRISSELNNHLVVDHGDKNPSYPHSLATINIMRGREVGLPSYNVYREYVGLGRVRSFQELTWMSPKQQEFLAKCYKSPDDVDLFPGGLSERPVPGGAVGPTFAYLISRGFRDWKYGDRFYFENSPAASPHPFTLPQLAAIRSIRMSRIVCDSLKLKEVPLDVFRLADRKHNPYVPCKTLPKLDFSLFRDSSA